MFFSAVDVEVYISPSWVIIDDHDGRIRGDSIRQQGYPSQRPLLSIASMVCGSLLADSVDFLIVPDGPSVRPIPGRYCRLNSGRYSEDWMLNARAGCFSFGMCGQNGRIVSIGMFTTVAVSSLELVGWCSSSIASPLSTRVSYFRNWMLVDCGSASKIILYMWAQARRPVSSPFSDQQALVV